ncbi:MAG: S9 family peptidase [Kofleriaceae bacterium]|nr:S9 family peptidase [Kofleriaceae bacterium]
MSTSNTISLEEVAFFPRPATSIPVSLKFSDAGRNVSFLWSEDGSLNRSLYSLDIESGARKSIISPSGGGDTEATLSAEEKLERERRRERGLGVTKYSWSSDNDVLLVPLGGHLFVQNGTNGSLRKLVDGGTGSLQAPQLSPDGGKLAFVRDNDIFTISTNGKDSAPVQLTTGGQANKVHGLAEYIAQEEMDRYEGYWWSQDGTHIAYTEIDETHLPLYRIMHQGSEDTGHAAQEDHGYPFAGQANAKVRLGVIPTSGGKTVWMDLGSDQDIYLARVHWLPSGELWAELENREQTQLDLLRFNLSNGEQSLVLHEESDVWINLHKSFFPLRDGGFVWASERSGFKHLYLYDQDASLVRQLTDGPWLVDEIVAVDQTAAQIYFLSGKEDPTQKQLFSVGLDGEDLRAITSEKGTHSVVISSDFSHFVDIHSSVENPPQVNVRNLLSGATVRTIWDTTDPKVEALKLSPPELVTLQTRDGVTLHGALYRPPSSFQAPYPTVISVYGGPHAQLVSDSWDLCVDMRAQYLCNQGYLVFKLDNRGSARRGLAFEGAMKHDMGNIELLDQVDGVEWLVEQGLADAKRVAMYGWSYGGYMSALALGRAPETFRVAIAGAPVTHWDGYDTHYTERYMGTPESNPKGYKESSVMHHLHKMEGRLMLIHGLIDENVHFRHSARLINALIDAQKDYELLLFPNERHMPRSQKDRVYMETRIVRFLDTHL